MDYAVVGDKGLSAFGGKSQTEKEYQGREHLLNDML